MRRRTVTSRRGHTPVLAWVATWIFAAAIAAGANVLGAWHAIAHEQTAHAPHEHHDGSDMPGEGPGRCTTCLDLFAVLNHGAAPTPPVTLILFHAPRGLCVQHAETCRSLALAVVRSRGPPAA